MGRKGKAKTKTGKKCEKAKSHIHEKEQKMIIHKLKEAVKFYNDTYNSSDFDNTAQTSSNVQVSPRRDSTFAQLNTNNRNEDIAYNNYKCYRCEHFLEIPSNLSGSSCNRVSTVIRQCEADLSFIQAMIWLKSIIACVSQIPINKLWQIFNKECCTQITYDNCNYSEEKRTNDVYVEQVTAAPATEDLPIYENTEIKNILTTPSLSDKSCNATPRVICESHSRSEDSQKESLVLTRNPNKFPVDCFTPERYTGCKTGRNNKCSRTFYIIPETDSEEENSETQGNMFDEPEHQNECIENILTPISSCHFDSLYNSPVDQVLTQITKMSISEIDDVMNWKQKSTGDSQADSDQISVDLLFSNDCNDDNFNTDVEFQIDDNNIDMRMENNDATENIEHDSAYSTSHIYGFNYNSILKFLDDNQRMPDTKTEYTPNTNTERTTDTNIKHHYELRNRKSQHEEVISSPSIIESKKTSNINNKRSLPNQESLPKKHRAEQVESLSKEKEENKQKTDTKTECTPDTNTQRILPDTNTKHRYELRSRKNKHEEVTNSPSIMESRKTSNVNNKCSLPNKLSLLKKHRLERAESLSKEKEKNEEKMVSTNWLNFILDSLNLEQVILESLKVILSKLFDERTAEEYATRRCWKDTLEEEAVNAVLNISDIFRMEKKLNIGRKEIITVINKTLDEMTMCDDVQLYKMFMWDYRIQIILELCNSLSICIEVTDHLIAKLKLFQFTLSEIMSQPINQLNFSITINQMRLIFYALNITLRKYRTVIPIRQAWSAKDVIPHPADLWKARYVVEELEDAGLIADTAEKKWINALENFKTCTLFVEKSISLLHILL